MSSADLAFIRTCREIIDHGSWVRDERVRPHWEDGERAYTKKCFCVVNRYDLSQEFPLLTNRPIGFKSCVDEILWIWQKKSNNIHDLHS
ncbi:MAG: thymidylate synthase, partial [Clostridia bacterium]|nr:thymidylate synthase [Clostridia bacterium]